MFPSTIRRVTLFTLLQDQEPEPGIAEAEAGEVGGVSTIYNIYTLSTLYLLYIYCISTDLHYIQAVGGSGQARTRQLVQMRRMESETASYEWSTDSESLRLEMIRAS